MELEENSLPAHLEKETCKGPDTPQIEVALPENQIFIVHSRVPLH